MTHTLKVSAESYYSWVIGVMGSCSPSSVSFCSEAHASRVTQALLFRVARSQLTLSLPGQAEFLLTSSAFPDSAITALFRLPTAAVEVSEDTRQEHRAQTG